MGGVASASESNRDRRERLKQLALETIDIFKDPYFMRNHLGTYECKLCLTLHNNEGSYLAHTQGKKHQANLGRRAAKERAEAPGSTSSSSHGGAKGHVDVKKFIKIGRPGYKVTKQRDPVTKHQSLLFQIDYPEIIDTLVPRHRFMSAYEQRVEPPDRKWQYLLFAAEPYETIAFKVPSREIDKHDERFWTHWNAEAKQFFLQVTFKNEPVAMAPPLQPMMQQQQQQQPPSNQMGGMAPPPPNQMNQLLNQQNQMLGMQIDQQFMQQMQRQQQQQPPPGMMFNLMS